MKTFKEEKMKNKKLEMANEIFNEMEMENMKNELEISLEIAGKRFEEMRQRRERFIEKYSKTGDKLSLELARDEQRQMNELLEAMLIAEASL